MPPGMHMSRGRQARPRNIKQSFKNLARVCSL